MSRARAAARLLARLAGSKVQHQQLCRNSPSHRAFCSTAVDGPSTSGRQEADCVQPKVLSTAYSLTGSAWAAKIGRHQPLPASAATLFGEQLLGALPVVRRPAQQQAAASSQAIYDADEYEAEAQAAAEFGTEDVSDAVVTRSHSSPVSTSSNDTAVQQVQQPDDICWPVKAYYIGGEIDLARCCKANNFYDAYMQRDHVVVRWYGMASDSVLVGDGSEVNEERYIVLYRFGSVVIFDSRSEEDDQALLDRIRDYTTEPLAKPRVEETTVVVRPRMKSWFSLEPDRVVVRKLDMNTARVISNVIGQSAALHQYNTKVDQAIELFTPILRDIAHHGRSGTIKSTQLLQHIGQNSLLYTDVVTKLGLLDTSELAWRDDRFYDVWCALRKDYEIDRRFEMLRMKLGPMLENAKFILEVREDKKTERSEVIIILLIFAEIVLHLAHHFLPQVAQVLQQV